MELTFAPRNILQIEGARIIWRNFEGRGDKYNREGDRNFALVIPDEEMKDALVEEGWNVRTRPARDEESDPLFYLPVKVKFNDRGPSVYLVTGPNAVKLNEDTVGMLDDVDILNVDLNIRPYDWEVSGKTGRSAYLQSIEVTQNLDSIDARHARRFEEDGGYDD